MEPIDALTAIIARCPDLLREATDALRAIRAGSPIAERRVAHVVARALSRYGEEFSPDERVALTALIAPDADAENSTRSILFPIRVTPDERDRLHAAASAEGRTASDYVRARLGLATR